ncbi:MAG TPA: ATPase [Pyrodictium sp.]|nr:ATPase [Pyrodictium sp.]
MLDVDLIATGNEELDSRLGGGLPAPNLLLIEGPRGSGKTILVQQIVYGSLKSGCRVLVISTELGVRDYLNQSKMVSLDVRKWYLKGMLEIITPYSSRFKWSRGLIESLADRLIWFLERFSHAFKVIAIDSITHFATNMHEIELMNFFVELRRVAWRGKLVVATLHSDILSEKLVTKLVALADSYFKLDFAEIGGRSVRVINVVKLRGTPGVPESSIAFEVDPSFGVKVVPLALAKA